MPRIAQPDQPPRAALALALFVPLVALSACGRVSSFNEQMVASYRSGLETDAQGEDAVAIPPADGGAGADDGADPAKSGGGDGSGDEGGDDANDLNTPPADVDDPDLLARLARLPKVGLLVNDLECGLCHVSVIGEVGSTRSVPPLWAGSDVALSGRWLAAAGFDGNVPQCADAACLGANVTVAARGTIVTNYRGPELPLDRDGDGAPDFPALDFAALEAKMRGHVKGAAGHPAEVTKVNSGNLVLVGTKSEPIELTDDILVKGDLVIKGYYKGVGSIYVTGNIYVPADLRALRSAFPYSSDAGQAINQAKTQIKKKSTDALGLATAGSIFIGDIEKHQNSDPGNEAVNVYSHPSTPPNRTAAALGVLNVFNWFPGGRDGFGSLYENAVSCVTQQATQIGSFNMIEAFLYAHNTVAGISRRASYTIRGGVIADYFHVVSGAARCNADASPVHGHAGNRSYVEYDYRMKTGWLRLLEYVGETFPAP
jgi:hypothetical protein